MKRVKVDIILRGINRHYKFEDDEDKFVAYMDEKTTDECLDDKGKISISGQEMIDYLHSLGIGNINEIQRYEKDHGDELLRKVKAIPGVTIR